MASTHLSAVLVLAWAAVFLRPYYSTHLTTNRWLPPTLLRHSVQYEKLATTNLTEALVLVWGLSFYWPYCGTDISMRSWLPPTLPRSSLQYEKLETTNLTAALVLVWGFYFIGSTAALVSVSAAEFHRPYYGFRFLSPFGCCQPYCENCACMNTGCLPYYCGANYISAFTDAARLSALFQSNFAVEKVALLIRVLIFPDWELS
jgi:hypothetical protein